MRLEEEKSLGDIDRLLELGYYDQAKEYMDLFAKVYGESEELKERKERLVKSNRPGLSVICFTENPKDLEKVKEMSDYPNLNLFQIVPDAELEQNIWRVIGECHDAYIGFWVPGALWEQKKCQSMIEFMETYPAVEVATCQIQFGKDEEKKAVTTKTDRAMADLYRTEPMKGESLLQFAIRQGVNIYGTLSCLIVRSTATKGKALDRNRRLLQEFDYESETFPFLFECIYGLMLGGINEALVTQIEKKLDLEELAKKDRILLKLLKIEGVKKLFEGEERQDHLPGVYRRLLLQRENRPYILPENRNKKKEMTFFYTDKGEYFNLEPLAEEAKQRGYETRFTTQLNEKVEIGVYCQHVCYPENAGLSIVLLHDMEQGHNRWPDLWNIERWNYFDIGILPGGEWAKRWKQCAGRNYTNPRYGVHELGYPKSDICMNPELELRAKELRGRMNLEYPVSVLYAPSWENDEKEDDFILALQSLPINLLVKQASWPPQYAEIIQNIKKMRQKHEGKYPNVHFIEPEESILTALKMCDLVVSDESSVMTEALLFRKPSIAVLDWLIPDTHPSRFAVFPGEYVTKCKRVQLRETVEQLVEKLLGGNEVAQTDTIFSNMGQVCADTMDLVDLIAGYRDDAALIERELKPDYMPFTLWG